MPKNTDERRQRFVDEYIIDLNATRAAKRAGYRGSDKVLGVTGARLLANARVAELVREAQTKRMQRTEITADAVLKELWRVARVDLGMAYDGNGGLLPVQQIPEDVRRAICSIDVEEIFEGSGEDRTHVGNVRKVKFSDKIRALEMLGKHLGLFVEKQEVSGPGGVALQVSLAQVSDSALRERLAALTAGKKEDKPKGRKP